MMFSQYIDVFHVFTGDFKRHNMRQVKHLRLIPDLINVRLSGTVPLF